MVCDQNVSLEMAEVEGTATFQYSQFSGDVSLQDARIANYPVTADSETIHMLVNGAAIGNMDRSSQTGESSANRK